MVKKVFQPAYWHGALLIISRHLFLPTTGPRLMEVFSRW